MSETIINTESDGYPQSIIRIALIEYDEII